MKKLMRTIQMMAALLTAVAATTACSSDDSIADEPNTTTDAPRTYTLTVEATKGGNDDATTRALGIDGTGALNATWTAGDEVSVYSITGEGYSEMESTTPVFTLTAQSSGATTTLTGTFNEGFTPTAGKKLRLRFCPNPDYSNQDGTLDYIAANCDNAVATVTITDVDDGGNVTTTAATFENQQAIVRFSLKDKATNGLLETTNLKVKYGTSTYDVMLDDPASDIFVAIPSKSNKDIVLIANTSDGNFGYEKSGVTFEKGKYYAINVKMEPRALTKELTAVTTSEIGWRIGSDGTAYEPTGNLRTGVTAVAMIGYISSTGNGLAIELNNDPCHVTFSDASTTATAGKPTIKGATWRLPSFDDWFNIITGCAVTGDQTSFPTIGSKGLNPIYGFQQKWLATGFTLNETGTGWFLWTSTETTSGAAYSLKLTFFGGATALFLEASKESSIRVLACLAF